MAGDDQSTDLFDAVLYDALAVKYPQKVRHIFSTEMREKLERQVCTSTSVINELY